MSEGRGLLLFITAPVIIGLLFQFFFGFGRNIDNYAPLIAGFIISLCIVLLYIKYGQKPKVNEDRLPETMHAPPKNRAAYEVSIAFRELPLETSPQKDLPPLIMEALLKGLVEIRNNILYVKNMKAIKKEFNPYLAHIFEWLNKRKVDGIDEFIAQGLERHLQFYARSLAYLYDTNGEDIFTKICLGVGVATLIIGTITITLFHANWVVPWVVGLGVEPLIIYGLYIFKGNHLLGRYSSKDAYMERLKWNRFAKLLKDESLMKKYGPKDISMWGKWLAYAYALGIPHIRLYKLKDNAKKSGYEKVKDIEIASKYSESVAVRLNNLNNSTIKHN